MCDTLVRVLSGRVLFAKNSDREPDEPQVLEWHPRASGLSGAVRCTHQTVAQVGQTHAVLLSRPVWRGAGGDNEMWGAEMGVNEHGVAIGNEAVFTREPVPRQGGLTGMDLLRLALERAATAAEAVEVLTSLAAEHGQGGRCGYRHRGFRYFSSFLVADPSRAFVVETAGRAHATEEVKGSRAISNGLTVPGFAEQHSDWLKTAVSQCRARRGQTEAFAAQAESPAQLAAALRSHGGTEWPRYDWKNGAMAAPCMHAGGLLTSSQTTASLVAELAPGRVRVWATGTSAPCVSLFKPVSVERAVEAGPAPADRPDGSLWWTHERLHRAVLRDPARLWPLIAEERDALERRFFASEVAPEEAWAEARAALPGWIARVTAAQAGDVRPWFARRHLPPVR